MSGSLHSGLESERDLFIALYITFSHCCLTKYTFVSSPLTLRSVLPKHCNGDDDDEDNDGGGDDDDDDDDGDDGDELSLPAD